jgi:hypothetical protein
MRNFFAALFALIASAAFAAPVNTTGMVMGRAASAAALPPTTIINNDGQSCSGVNVCSLATTANIGVGQTVVVWLSSQASANFASLSDPTAGSWSASTALSCCVPNTTVRQFTKTFSSPLASGGLLSATGGGGTFISPSMTGLAMDASYTPQGSAGHTSSGVSTDTISASGFTGSNYISIVALWTTASVSSPPVVTGTGTWIAGPAQLVWNPAGLRTWYQIGSGTSASFTATFTSNGNAISQTSVSK